MRKDRLQRNWELLLIEMVVEAEKTGRSVSTWDLASKLSSKLEDIKKLDMLFRYYLNKLAEKGLLVKLTVNEKGRKLARFIPNPNRIVCIDGAMWILDNPVTVINCPYIENCNCQNLPEDLEKVCLLYRNSPPEVKNLIKSALTKSLVQ